MALFDCSTFVLLIHNSQIGKLNEAFDKYKTILENTKSYQIGEFQYVQVDVYEPRPKKEVASFIFRNFPFVAIRQEGSTYILVKEKELWKQHLTETFTKQTKHEYLYNMLSIDERYDALEEACMTPITGFESVRIERWIGGCMYSLMYEKGKPDIFTDDPEVYLLFEDNGYEADIDICDGLYLFKFHIAILK